MHLKYQLKMSDNLHVMNVLSGWILSIFGQNINYGPIPKKVDTKLPRKVLSSTLRCLQPIFVHILCVEITLLGFVEGKDRCDHGIQIIHILSELIQTLSTRSD